MHEQTIQYTHHYRNWCDILQLDKTKTIHYLEIGSLHGGSVCAFHTNFGPNVISETIDPFSVCDNYQDYNENKNYGHYEIFKYNTKSLNNTHYKIPSFRILPTLQNNYYDVIYIDGNHNLCNILEDAIYSVRKLKSKGYLILDDYDWNVGIKNTKSTMKAFIHAFCPSKLNFLFIYDNQVFLQKP